MNKQQNKAKAQGEAERSMLAPRAVILRETAEALLAAPVTVLDEAAIIAAGYERFVAVGPTEYTAHDFATEVGYMLAILSR